MSEVAVVVKDRTVEVTRDSVTVAIFYKQGNGKGAELLAKQAALKLRFGVEIELDY